MSHLTDVGDRDGWRCWICDEAVDAGMSVNDPRGPSTDSRVTKAKTKRSSNAPAPDRLAHRGCNTMKGAKAAVVPWPSQLFVADPAPILASVERLTRKGGREVMARCPSLDDAQAAAAWLADRVDRLEPDLRVSADVEPGGGQYLVILRAEK